MKLLYQKKMTVLVTESLQGACREVMDADRLEGRMNTGTVFIYTIDMTPCTPVV